MAFSPAGQIVGVAKETVVGTAVAATQFPKVEKFNPITHIGDAPDHSLRASAADVYGTQPTTIYSEIDWSGQLTPDDIGWFVASQYGAVTTTGAGAPFTHTMSLLNTGSFQGPTHTWTHFNGQETRQYASSRCADIMYKYAAGQLINVSGKLFAATQAIGTKPTQSYTPVAPTPAWETTVSIAGSQSLAVVDIELTTSRTTTAEFTVQNTQVPYLIFQSGDMKATGKLTLIYDATNIALFNTTYLAGTPVVLVINTTAGAGAALVQVQHTMSVVYLTDAKVIDGKEFMQLEVTFTAQANTTDAGTSLGYSPIKTIIQNALPAATYA